MQQTELQQAVKVLESKIRSVKGRFTLQDAASVTGLGVEEAKDALDQMMQKYVCRLTLTDLGTLIYDFGSLRRRGEKTAREIVADIGLWLYKAFTVVFKIWITVMLIVYFLIFLAILIGLMFSGRDRDRKVNIPMGNIFLIFFQWNTSTGRMAYQSDRGYRYRSYESRKSLTNPNKKSLIAAVYDFVFGPGRVNIDPLADAREVAAFLKEEKGVVTSGEIVALSGRSYEQAEIFLSDVITRFQGEVELSDNGVVYGRFDELTQSTEEIEDAKIEYFWDEYEAPYEMNGNKSSRNFLIAFFNAFNLVFSTIVLNLGLGGELYAYAPYETQIVIVLGWIPFVFSLLFFLIPLLRWFKINKLRRQREETNHTKRVLGYLLQKPDRADTFENVVHGVNADRDKPELTEDVVRKILEKILTTYQGETRLKDDGTVIYALDRIQADYTEAQRIRLSRRIDSSTGQVIFEN